MNLKEIKALKIIVKRKMVSFAAFFLITLKSAVASNLASFRRSVLSKSKIFLDNLPAVANRANDWLLNSIHITADKDPILKGAYLRKVSCFCECLPRNDAVLYFIFLPLLFFGSITLTYRHHIDQVSFATKQEAILAAPLVNISDSSINIPQFDPLAQPNNHQKRSLVNPNKIEYVSATIHRSIFLSGKRAGLSPKMVSQFMAIFSGTVNFAKDVHDGDRFMLLYRKNPAVAIKMVAVRKNGKHGKKSKVISQVKTDNTPEIIAAELVNHNKVYRAIRFTDADGRTDYYTPAGVSLNPAFVRAPVKYTRIGSRFSLHRWHPILHIYRAHLGVDFVAPMGTPLKATANGRIAMQGSMGGYGNAVLIRHDNKYSTFYAHLSRFAKGLKVGSVVHRDQVVGYVGMSGLATGPHVHYEFRVYGLQHDPLAVKLPHASITSRKNRIKFLALVKTLLAQLDSHLPQYASNTVMTEKDQSLPV